MNTFTNEVWSDGTSHAHVQRPKYRMEFPDLHSRMRIKSC